MIALSDEVEITERNRFTNFVRANDAEAMALLERWVRWFQKDGIPAVIAFSDQESEGDRVSRRVAAVYRVGLEDSPEG